MSLVIRCLAAMSLAAIVSGCGTSRSEFTPQGGPPTVGMPAELSDREREQVFHLENALRERGYLPVRYGAGDLQLEFEIAEGPINTDTTIELHEGPRLVAEGHGRGSGAPLIGRSKIAERSFQRAFAEFQASLSGAPAAGLGGPEPSGSVEDGEYVY